MNDTSNHDNERQYQYARVKNALDRLILLTPTGEERNALCDANLHILLAEDIRLNPNGVHKHASTESQGD